MDKGVKMPLVEGSIYHMLGGKKHKVGVPHTMGRRFDITWIGGSIYHG